MIEILCKLVVYGREIDFDSLVECVGVPGMTRRRKRAWGAEGWHPSDTWWVEARSCGSAARPADSAAGWEYPSVEGPTASVLAMVGGREESLRDYCDRHGLEIIMLEVVFSGDAALPIMTFSPEVMQVLGKLRATLDFDIYTHRDE